MYTTHGLMSPEDLADHHRLYDTGPHPHCPGHEESGQTIYCPAADACTDEEPGE